MKRLFWMSVGAAVGILVVRKVSEAARSYTPTGLSAQVLDRLGEIGDGLLDLADAVREGMAERESELREALGIDVPSDSAARMDGARVREVMGDPAGPRAR